MKAILKIVELSSQCCCFVFFSTIGTIYYGLSIHQMFYLNSIISDQYEWRSNRWTRFTNHINSIRLLSFVYSSDVLSIYSISILKFSSKLSFYQDICDYKLTFFLRRKAPLANLSCFDLVNNYTKYKTWSSTVLKPVFVWPEFWTRRTIFHCLSSQAEKRQSKATIFNI